MGFEAPGKRVLVTGASSGIGAGLAVAFAGAGATVGATGRNPERLRAVWKKCLQLAPASKMWVADLADPKAIDALAATAVTGLGGVDVLVNCAGIPKRRHVTRLDPATVENVMWINYQAPIRLTLALLPHLLERDDPRIINFSSIAAPLSSPGEAAYDASKAALAVFSEAMAVDLWDTPLKVMIVYPGIVDTDLFRLPDNDPPIDAVPPITVNEAVRAVFEGLGEDALQVYTPKWFAKLTADKAADVEGFLAGSAEFVRSYRARAGESITPAD